VPAGVKARLELPSDLPRLPYEIETALFRAAQEVIINIERHARADRALIQVRKEPDDYLVIEIEDDGEGFDPAALKPSPEGRGLGLLGVRERIDLIGGVTEIDSAPGAGTRVVLRVPITVGATEGSCHAFES
jgi:signal transduction histidine kinase